VKNKHARSKS